MKWISEELVEIMGKRGVGKGIGKRLGMGSVIILAGFLVGQIAMGSVDKFFPPLVLTEITPAFEGSEIKLTSESEMMKYLERIAKNAHHMELKYLDGESSRGRKIPYALLTHNGFDPNKLTVWIMAQQHGEEHGAGEAALGIIGYLSSEGSDNLENMNVIVVPRANIDGAAANNRFSKGVDMNMDYMKLELPETRAIKKGILQYNPHVIMDLHEYPANPELFAKLPGSTILPYYDILTYPTANHNAPTSMFTVGNQFIAGIKSYLNGQNIRQNFYYNTIRRSGDELMTLELPTSSVGVARNHFGVYPAVAFLVEGRGQGLDLEYYKRRVESLVDAAKSVISTAHNQASRIKDVVDAARYEIAHNRKRDLIVVVTGIERRGGSYQFIDVASETPRTFNPILISDTAKDGGVQRNRPLGYIFDSSESDIIDLLNAHGIGYKALTNGVPMEIEEYIFEDRKMQISARELLEPEGMIFVDIAQQQGNIIPLLFEPESVESMLYHKIVKISGDRLPYNRVTKIHTK